MAGSTRTFAAPVVTRRRLGRGQVVLAVLLGLVVAGSQLLGLHTVWSLTSVARTLDQAQGITAGVTHAHHEALRLRLQLEQEPVLVEGARLQAVTVRRELDLLADADLPPEAENVVSTAATAADGVVTSLGSAAVTAAAGDAGVLRDADALDATAPSVRTDARRAENLLRDLNAASDDEHYSLGIDTVIDRRDQQVVAAAASAAALLLAAGLALSLRRAVRRDFGTALRQLVREQHDRTEAQAVASRTERRFTALVRQGDDLILVLSPERLITFATPAVARIAGLDDPSDLVGRPFVDLVAEGERRTVIDALDRAYSASGETVHVDLRVCDLPGSQESPSWLSVALTDLRNDPAVDGLVVNAHDITDRVVRASMLEHLAYHDRVTGLPNRLGAERHLDGAGPGERFAIAVLDLDGFGALNDDAGPAQADAALSAIGAALELRTFPSAFVAHFGADVFAVITPSWVGTPADVARRAGRVLAEGVELGGRRFCLTAGMGAAASIGLRGNDALRLAESAMHEAKRSGDGALVVHDENRLEQLTRRSELIDGLERAGEADELRLHHQPLVSLRTGLVTGTEALLRWQRDGALVPPTDFVPLAEETGLIVPLGTWVLRQACADVAAMDAAGRSDMRISVNVSPRQLAEHDFVANVAATMAELGTDPARIVLELTESAIGEHADCVASQLADLHAAGHSIALDDFGSGYSSLSHLVRMPVDIVKLDRSFVADIETSSRTRQMVRALVKVCHDLGLSVTVEGVETPGQLEEVRLAGCDTAQGFLLARPQQIEDLLGTVGDARPALTGRGRA